MRRGWRAALFTHCQADGFGFGHKAPVRLRNGDIDEVHRRVADEAGDEERLGPVVQFIGRVKCLQMPAVHHSDAVGHGHRFQLIVGHINRSDSQVLLQMLDLPAHGQAAGARPNWTTVSSKSSTSGSLTSARPQGDALLLPAGKLPGPAIQQFADAHHVGDLPHALVLNACFDAFFSLSG